VRAFGISALAVDRDEIAGALNPILLISSCAFSQLSISVITGRVQLAVLVQSGQGGDLIRPDQPRRIYRRSSHRLTSLGIGSDLPSIESEVKHIGSD
jgi:hypothetical protein